MKKNKHSKTPVVGEYKYNPYMPSNPKAGMKQPTIPKPIKVLADEIKPKKWVGIILISFIPIINLIAFMAWSKKSNYGTNPNVKTYAKAGLLLYPILYVLLGVGAVLAKFVFHLF
ncbi:MAG: hypothetical protein BWX72_00817 [Firmicutes bacterium ADurb.Bin080]|nr:MAG: hypothetical protein BWX72_00817 [Firmicutes bacterium ADurb.Bin080]